MIEDTTVMCPNCEKELKAKVSTSGKRPVYIVGEDCPNCKLSFGKIEKFLNRSGKSNIRYEKGYLKTKARG